MKEFNSASEWKAENLWKTFEDYPEDKPDAPMTFTKAGFVFHVGATIEAAYKAGQNNVNFLVVSEDKKHVILCHWLDGDYKAQVFPIVEGQSNDEVMYQASELLKTWLEPKEL